MEQLQRASSPFRFTIPSDAVPKLRALRARQSDWRELIDAEDVVHLSYGLGPAWFLTFDGRILVDMWDWDGSEAYEETDRAKACTAVVLAANYLREPALLQVLPQRPHDAGICPRCGGSGWIHPPPAEGERGLVCHHCAGLGWLS